MWQVATNSHWYTLNFDKYTSDFNQKKIKKNRNSNMNYAPFPLRGRYKLIVGSQFQINSHLISTLKHNDTIETLKLLLVHQYLGAYIEKALNQTIHLNKTKYSCILL